MNDPIIYGAAVFAAIVTGLIVGVVIVLAIIAWENRHDKNRRIYP